MAHGPGSSGNGASRGPTDASYAPRGYGASPTARTGETAARLRQSVASLLAVAQDYAARRLREIRATLRMTAREMAVGAAMLLAAAALGGLALCLALAGCVLLLMFVLPAWVSVFIVCGILLLATTVLALVGIRRLRTKRLAAMIQTLRDDMERVRDALFGSYEPHEDRARPRATTGATAGEPPRT